MRKKLFFLKQQQLTQEGTSDDAPLFPAGLDQKDKDGAEEEVKVKKEVGTSEGGEEADTLIDEDDLLKHAYEDYESGSYSPKLLKMADMKEEVSLGPNGTGIKFQHTAAKNFLCCNK